jgi:elongation factor Ts
LRSNGSGDLAKSPARKLRCTSQPPQPAAATVADELDPALVEERKAAFLTEQARESGKPDNVIEG